MTADYSCPKCEGTIIHVQAEATVKLTPQEFGQISGFDWSRTSSASCEECGFESALGYFEDHAKRDRIMEQNLKDYAPALFACLTRLLDWNQSGIQWDRKDWQDAYVLHNKIKGMKLCPTCQEPVHLCTCKEDSL